MIYHLPAVATDLNTSQQMFYRIRKQLNAVHQILKIDDSEKGSKRAMSLS